MTYQNSQTLNKTHTPRPIMNKTLPLQPVPEKPPGERVQKVLAHAGLGSRREIETWIRKGNIRVNGVVAQLGDRITPKDKIHVNGRWVDLSKYSEQPTRVLLYHKPLGEVVSRRDPEGRPVVFTQLPRLNRGRWISVGRLDINTQGLLLVTNNGELANRLMHPASQLERKYAVRIFGKVENSVIDQLLKGIELDDGFAKFNSIREAGGEGINRWFHVTVSEGRNRIVRRLWESQQMTVSRLIRIRYGNLSLPERLKARTFYELDEKELKVLIKTVDL